MLQGNVVLEVLKEEKETQMKEKARAKRVPRMSIADTHRHLTKADIYRVPQKERIAIVERAVPWLVKPPKLRKLIRLSVQKAHGKKLADALDALLESVDTLYDLEQQDGAHNPGLVERQQSGAIRRELIEVEEKLSEQWRELYMLV